MSDLEDCGAVCVPLHHPTGVEIKICGNMENNMTQKYPLCDPRGTPSVTVDAYDRCVFATNLYKLKGRSGRNITAALGSRPTTSDYNFSL